MKDMDEKFFLCVEIGGTNLRYGVVTKNYTLKRFEKIPTNMRLEKLQEYLHQKGWEYKYTEEHTSELQSPLQSRMPSSA